MPSAWTAVPQPPQHEQWSCHGVEHFFPQCLREPADTTLYAFGDASGGQDTNNPHLRWVGVGAAIFYSLEGNDMEIRAAFWG
eukprot:8504213-Pyramimonas_sp.AAC.1